MAEQQSLFSSGRKAKTKPKKTKKPKTTATTKIKVSGYERRRGKLPARARNGKFKRGG